MFKSGAHVKLLLIGGGYVEGIVEEWGTTVKLKSIAEESILIIHHPERDIVVTKFFDQKNEDIVEANVNDDVEEEIIQAKPIYVLEKEFEETYDLPSDDDLRIKKLSELRIELNNQERKMIADKLKDQKIEKVKKVEYDYPGFFKKPGA